MKCNQEKTSTYTHLRGVGVRVTVGLGVWVDVAVGVDVPGVDDAVVAVGVFVLIDVPTGSVV